MIIRRGMFAASGAELNPINPLELDGLLVGFDYSDLTTLFQLSDGTEPVTADLDPVGRINSVVGSLYADQSTATARVLYRTDPDRVTFDESNDAYIVRLGAPQAGTFFTATTEGVVVGTFTGGADYQIPINPLYPAAENNQTYKLLFDRVLTSGEVDGVVAWLKENKNAGNDVYTGGWSSRFRLRSDITSLDVSRWDTSGVTGFQIAWSGCSGLTSFPLLDTSSGTSFNSAWIGCTGLTSFPLLDISASNSFISTWQNCTGLTSFPLLDTSSGIVFISTWQNCSGLTSFPLLDTSSGTSFSAAWSGCTGLTSFPLLDTSSGTNFSSAWRNCTGLTSFPLLDTSSGTRFNDAWSDCTGLTSFPLINTASGEIFSRAWFGCTSLATFPANFFDGCAATVFSNAFLNTNLSETSIDAILVSINSNGTSGGEFDQSGGSAPSVATGQPAIDALRDRGWTVGVTGGY